MNDETGLLVSLWPVNHYRYMLLCGGAPEPEPTHSNFRERKKTSTVLVSCVVLQNRNRTEPTLAGFSAGRKAHRTIFHGLPFPHHHPRQLSILICTESRHPSVSVLPRRTHRLEPSLASPPSD
jgi:hypothetical protein